MAAAAFNIGDVVRLSGAFTSAAGAPVDPTAVTVKVQFPDKTIVTYTDVSSPAIVKDSTGKYHLDLPLTMEGRHQYRYAGIGANAATEESYFNVDLNAF